MKTLCTLALGLLLAAGSAGAAELKEGDVAPDFSLQGSDGKTYKLSDFRGKSAVVVAWYPKAFTGGCTTECKNMKSEGDKIREFNVAYFTASVDEADYNKKFAESLSLDYPILSDPTKKTAAEYGALNAKGVSSRYTYYIGADGRVLYIDKAVKPATASADIAKKLAELGVPKKS